MKTQLIPRLLPAVLWLVLTPCNAPAQGEPPPPAAPVPVQPVPVPRFQCDTSALVPESVLEIDFPAAVVPAAAVNTEAPATLLKTDPAVSVKGIWTSRNTARFSLTAPVPLGATVSFSLPDGHKYEDGTAIPAALFGNRTAPVFAVTRFVARSSDKEREPVFVLIFNDDITPEQAAPFLIFTGESGAKVPAKSGPLYHKDSGGMEWALGYGNQVAVDSWTERWKVKLSGAVSERLPDGIVPHAMVVRPHVPLPTGTWKLEAMIGLPNVADSARTAAAGSSGTISIRPLTITNSWHTPGPSGTAVLHARLSRELPADASIDWKKWATVEPFVNDLKVTREGSELTFASPEIGYRRDWTIIVRAGTPSVDGISAAADQKSVLKPAPDDPDLSLPSWDTAQLAAGERSYRIHTKNLKSARVRVKLLTDREAVTTLRGYASMKPEDSDSRSGKAKRTDLASEGAVPWSLVPGRTLLDRTWEFEGKVDNSYPIVLDWSKLLPGEKSPGVLFVSTEGESLPAALEPGKPAQHRVAQALVQLTDIGLAWKLNHAEAVLYAFSLKTGRPLPGTKLTLLGAEGSETGVFMTDAQGICRVPRVPGAQLLTASLGGDQFTVAFDRTLPRESLWRFPVDVDWDPAKDFRRHALMFTDRGLYRPGETVHMKGIVRKRLDTDLRLPDDKEAEFVVLDSDEKEFVRKKVTLSAQGTFSEMFALPPEKVGRFSLRLEFPRPAAPAETAGSEEDGREGEFEGEYIYSEGGDDSQYVFTEGFRVEEFRKNTFEIHVDAPKPAAGAASAEVSVAANYFMGQNLSEAQVRYYVNAAGTGFYPEKYSAYQFGDHEGYDPYYWSYYYGWGGRNYDESEVNHGADNQTGELAIGADGKVIVPVTIPKTDFPTAHQVAVSVEITDVNQQTLTERAGFRVEAADIHAGIARIDRLVHTAEAMPLQFVALTTAGAPVTRPVPVHVKIDQEVFETVRVQTDSGFSQTRSDARRTTVKEEDITIPAGTGDRAAPFTYQFIPEKAGCYYVELRARDDAGLETATRTRVWVYGAGDYAWEYEQGSRIKLVPEKKSWKPGETARILVMTPIDGTALVTLERSGVVRAFTVPLSTASPVLEIPVKDEDAPNVYVSVMVIKGLADNKREVKEPLLKLGYCQLVVEDTKSELAVSVKVPRPSYRPGSTAEILGEVKNREGQPVSGAEITVWVVDEGVLTVMGYENPDPQTEFMPLMPLGVRAGTSLSLYLPEDSDQRWYVNKGFLVGGGGEDDEGTAGRLRKDFNPLAFWQADVRTDDHGHYAVKFTVPDSLTRYRVLAMAVKGARGFGMKTGALTVNKPLMVEPVVPRFASVGDRLVPKAVVHNTSPWSGTFAVTMEMDEEARFIGEGESPRRSVLRQIDLAAGETKSVTWEVEFTHYGDAVWRWRAEPIKLPAESLPADRAEMVDFVENHFPVTYPGPLLSESHGLALTQTVPSADLLHGFSPELLKRATRVELELSRSRFIDGAEAIDYLLHYPYGCVEQTSSSTVPWFAARAMKPLLPKLKRSDEEIRRAIQGGADRLLTMQTDSGGLAYWPGGEKPELWASALGGMTLLTARENGAVIPQERVDKLAAWLSSQLRGLGAQQDGHVTEDSALALYALSLAGKPEPAYAAALFDRRAGLTNAARSYLALALAKAGSVEQARTVLAVPAPADAPHPWRHYDYDTGLRLLALSHADPASAATDALVDKLMAGRNTRGHWNNTWCNGWAVHGLAAWSSKVEKPQLSGQLALTGMAAQTLAFADASPAYFLDLRPQAGQPVALAASLGSTGSVYARVKLTGQPELLPMRPVDSGMSITRTYERLTTDGKLEPLGEPNVGDLVLVSLALRVPGDVWYIAVDDPLPCTFEAVNNAFESQSAGSAAADKVTDVNWSEWASDHEELRDDRALFFCDYVRGGNYRVKYLARVTGVGEATAAQAKIEAMYDPQRYGLSTSERVKTQPRAPQKQAAAR